MLTLVLLTALGGWPDPGALRVLELPKPPRKKIRVVVDAGHGAPGNAGNQGCLCQRERDTTLAEAGALARALAEAGPFEVLQTRTGDAEPAYPARIAAAEAFKPDAIISLHTDARGEATAWDPADGGQSCWRNDAEPGFAVLWSPAGDKKVVAAREKLGRAVGRRMRESGFTPYDGVNYPQLYTEDPVEPAGWIDIRGPRTRVYFLHASQVPTVIVETHHALDVREVARWEEPATQRAFAAAIAAALIDVYVTP